MVPDDRLAETAQRWAERVLALPPQHVYRTKALMRSMRNMPDAPMLDREVEARTQLNDLADTMEAARAFAEKRTPKFQGRLAAKGGRPMEYEDIAYEVRDQIATITLNRPERMNSFSDALLGNWADAIGQAAQDDDVRVLVVTGAGRAFCAGADLKARAEQNEILAASEDQTPAMRRNSLRYSVHRVPQALQYLDKPYIAAVNGPAVGAGMDMASMADLRFASDQARFGMAYVRVGLVPGDGGAWLLPRLVGLQKALELIWSGELFGADDALEMGYVTRVVPHDSLLDEVYAYAAKLAEGPPITMQLAKRLIYRGLDTPFMEALDAAQAAMTIVQTSEDSKEGPKAFAEKRQPIFQGR